LGNEDPDSDVKFAFIDEQGLLNVFLNDEGVILNDVPLARLGYAVLFIVLIDKTVQGLVECKYLPEQIPVFTSVSDYMRDVCHWNIFGLGGGADLVHIPPSAVLSDEFLNLLKAGRHMNALTAIHAGGFQDPHVLAGKMTQRHLFIKIAIWRGQHIGIADCCQLRGGAGLFLEGY
jgi:hypothetical protein